MNLKTDGFVTFARHVMLCVLYFFFFCVYSYFDWNTKTHSLISVNGQPIHTYTSLSLFAKSFLSQYHSSLRLVIWVRPPHDRLVNLCIYRCLSAYVYAYVWTDRTIMSPPCKPLCRRLLLRLRTAEGKSLFLRSDCFFHWQPPTKTHGVARSVPSLVYIRFRLYILYYFFI